jgi:hypothetical protein
VRDRVTIPYNTTGKISVCIYFNIPISKEEMRRQKILKWSKYQAHRKLNLRLIFSYM